MVCGDLISDEPVVDGSSKVRKWCPVSLDVDADRIPAVLVYGGKLYAVLALRGMAPLIRGLPPSSRNVRNVAAMAVCDSRLE